MRPTKGPAILTGTMSVRVLLVDDNVRFLDAARALLEREGFTVVASVSTTADAVAAIATTDPDVALVDVDLGPESGFDVAKRLTADSDRPTVVLISTYAEQDLKDLIDASPAVGFLSKSKLSGDAVRALLARPDR